jgi:hypothetical protein
MASLSHSSFTIARKWGISPGHYLTVRGSTQEGDSWWVVLQSDVMQATRWFKEDVTKNGIGMVKIYCIAENKRKAFLTEHGSDCGGLATSFVPHCCSALVDCHRHENALWRLCGAPPPFHPDTLMVKLQTSSKAMLCLEYVGKIGSLDLAVILPCPGNPFQNKARSCRKQNAHLHFSTTTCCGNSEIFSMSLAHKLCVLGCATPCSSPAIASFKTENSVCLVTPKHSCS